MAYGFSWVGLRKVDYTIACNCGDTVGGTRTPLASCSRCMGIGHPFTDELVNGYVWRNFFVGSEFPTQLGKISTQGRSVVLQHTETVNKFDWILILDLDPETGQPRQPFSIQQSFIIVDAFALRGKDGRLEFWRCALQERNISDGRPGKGGTSFNYGTNLE